MYELEEEPPLEYSMLCMIDGNQLLKLIDYMFRAGHQRLDDCSIQSEMWLSPSKVDVFKDEVKKVRSMKDFDTLTNFTQVSGKGKKKVTSNDPDLNVNMSNTISNSEKLSQEEVNT
jgi:hypothetical protein